MTDTTKTTLAEELRANQSFAGDSAARRPETSWGRAVDIGQAQAFLTAANMVEQHEARWAAERAKLVEDYENELAAFRALAKRAAHRVKTHFEHAITDDDRALAKLAPGETPRG